MSGTAWTLDEALVEHLSRALARRGVDVPLWLGELLRTDVIADVLPQFLEDSHVSTMGSDYCGNFEPIDEPCAVDIPLRLSLDHRERIVHVREMPLDPRVTYANYRTDEDDGGDEHGLWSSPILVIEGETPPDAVCSAMAGGPVSRVVNTGIDALDGLTISWARVEPGDIANRVPHGRNTFNPMPPSLVLRLAETPHTAIIPTR